jgi:hypothetical protein
VLRPHSIVGTIAISSRSSLVRLSIIVSFSSTLSAREAPQLRMGFALRSYEKYGAFFQKERVDDGAHEQRHR